MPVYVAAIPGLVLGWVPHVDRLRAESARRGQRKKLSLIANLHSRDSPSSPTKGNAGFGIIKAAITLARVVLMG